MQRKIGVVLMYGLIGSAVTSIIMASPRDNMGFTNEAISICFFGFIGAIFGYVFEVHMDTLDINSRGEYPANALSNLASHEFWFDGVKCASMEGFLQALKSPGEADNIVKLSGIVAKATGQNYNNWKDDQRLWWCHMYYDRDSKEYQDLLDLAFEALAKNEDFQKALLAIGNKRLVHTIGVRDITDTVLTEKEFCSRLTKLRKDLVTKKGV